MQAIVLPIRVLFSAIVAGFALFPLAAMPAGEIHRCVENGRITYTDRACTEGGSVIAIASMTSVATGYRDQAVAPERAAPISLGMSPRLVYDMLGRPAETIATLEGRNLVEYWVYRDGGGTTRVVFQEGRVTRIHTR